MATQAVRLFADEGHSNGSARESVAPPAPMLVPAAGYAPPDRPKLIAAAAALLITGMAVAPLAFMNVYRHHHHRHHLSVYDLKELRLPPPEHRPHHQRNPEMRHLQMEPVPVPPSPLPIAPPPIVEVPAPPVIATAPAPTAPAVARAEGPAAPPRSLHGDDLASKVISATPPSYPMDSRRLREQGTVLLFVTLGEDGRVAELVVRESSGSRRLDKAALDAVRRWRWAPTLVNGAPVMVAGLVKIPFVLKG